jgi:polysaccharide chain length determinant protein (PEP-CTERM system associated)
MAAGQAGPGHLRTLFLEQVIAVWKRKWLVLGVAWAFCVVGWAGVMFVPQHFESNARAYVDVNGLLAPLLKGLVVDTTPAASEEYLRQTLLSRPHLDQVIVMANLAGPSMTSIQHEELVNALTSQIKVTTDGNDLVSISYANRNPQVAKNVVDALLTIFAEKVANSNRLEMDNARAFLNGQIAQYEAQLRAAEQRRAAFRKKYANYFTESGVARPELLGQQVSQFQQQYDDAIATRNAIAAQMAQVPALLSVYSPPAVSNSGQIVVASPETRLAQAKRNLADLQLLYTDKHPDVIAARRSVAELQSDVEADKKTGGTNEGKAQISNPSYEQLRLKLVDSETVLPTLRTRLEKAKADYAQAKSLSGNLPEIEAMSQDVDRDYDVIKTNYDELVKRRESANLSQAADDRADRTQFRVVDPPITPISPAFPNHVLLFTFVTILGIAAGVASPLLLQQVHPTFASTARLRELGLPVMGGITVVRAASGRAFFVAGGLFAAGLGSLLVAYASLILASAGFPSGLR